MNNLFVILWLTIIYHIDVLYLVYLPFKLATGFCPNYYHKVILSNDWNITP